MLSTIAVSTLFVLVLVMIFIFFVSGQARRGHAVEDAGEKLGLLYMPVWFKEQAAALAPAEMAGEPVGMYILEGEGSDEGIVIADLKSMPSANKDPERRYTTVAGFPYDGPRFRLPPSDRAGEMNGDPPSQLADFALVEGEAAEANGRYLILYHLGRRTPPEEYAELLDRLRRIRTLLD